MRICEKHRERATDTLISKKTGIEYDLCAICEKEISEILNGREEPKRTSANIGTNPAPGRPKKKIG